MEEMSEYYKSIDKIESDIEAFYAWHPESHECWKYSKTELQSFIVSWRTRRGETDWKHCHELARIIVGHGDPSKRSLNIPFLNRGRLTAIDMAHITVEGCEAIANRIQTVLMKAGIDEEAAARMAIESALSMVGRSDRN